MKLIIDIPKKTYNEISESTTIKCGEVFAQKLLKYIKNGIPLEQEPCDNAISRQAVLDLAKKGVLVSNGNYKSVCKAINELPPVKLQEPKTGHWIEKDGFDGDVYYDCSECGESWTTIEGTPWQNGMDYCPNCGCLMDRTEFDEYVKKEGDL